MNIQKTKKRFLTETKYTAPAHTEVFIYKKNSIPVLKKNIKCVSNTANKNNDTKK